MTIGEAKLVGLFVVFGLGVVTGAVMSQKTLPPDGGFEPRYMALCEMLRQDGPPSAHLFWESDCYKALEGGNGH